MRVIGQSLGGILGRELARRNPGGVGRLVTLGSPMSLTVRRQSRARGLNERYGRLHVPEYAFDMLTKSLQVTVPTTSIYSHSDGIVRWEACRLPWGPLTENIEVYASHCGTGVHPAAVYAVLDRLAAPLDPWERFAPPAHLRRYFPNPA